jgi:quercetin dioxygenase-like cupin family protein
MYVFNLKAEQVFDPKKHMERVLGRIGEGDVTIACWEPGQTSPYHCHPDATEIYFCFEGGGKMKTPTETIEFGPGEFVVHPRGELHEFANGPQRTLLFRVRYGNGMSGRTRNGRATLTGSRVPRTSSILRPRLANLAVVGRRVCCRQPVQSMVSDGRGGNGAGMPPVVVPVWWPRRRRRPSLRRPRHRCRRRARRQQSRR